MSSNRMSFVSLFLIFFVFPFTYSSDFLSRNNFDSQEWISSYVDHMNPEEVQIVGNFLYLLYANGLIDTEIQKCYLPLAQLSQIARNNLSNPGNLNNELVQLHALTEKLSAFVRARFLYTRLLHDLLNYCDENKHDNVEKALKALQLHAFNMLSTWAHENNQQFTRCLEKSSKTISDCEKSIHYVAGLHKALSAGELPFVVEDQNKPLAIMNVVLQTTPTFLHTADTAANILEEVCRHAMKTICLGAELYKEYYTTIHNIMMQESFDKKSATTFLDEYSALPNEYNSLLPEPDLVLEHMVAITKRAHQEYAVNNL